MSENKFTSGPWRVIGSTDIIGVENDPANRCAGEVDVAHVYLRTVAGRTSANAHLIAAAPMLYEALQQLLDAADESDGCQYGTLSTSFVRDIAEAALKLARGEI